MTATADSRSRRRRLERHSAAALRAVAGQPAAELTRAGLRLADRPVAIATPYLSFSAETASVDRSRGVADGLGLLLRHSDLDLHRSLSPEPPFERVVFDILEQLRCESLVDPRWRGTLHNLDAAFEAWSNQARAERMHESGLGVLLYTVTQMARSRLVRGLQDEDVEAIIEATWFNLAPQIGHAFALLKPNRFDQTAYAEHAVEVARLVAEIAGSGADSFAEEATSNDTFRLLLPLDWDGGDTPEDGDDAAVDDALVAPGLTVSALADGTLDRLGGYTVYTREHDREVTGADLYPASIRERLRRDLDDHVQAQAVSPSRLAHRLRRLFSEPERDDWSFGHDDGVLDGRRLAQMVADPMFHSVFQQERHTPTSPAVVSFLIDTSGSMKAQRFEAVAVLVDTYCRALDLAGIASEVLGFTTGAWSGGRAAAEWRAAGSPESPGRLNEALHIVYKDADTRWRRSKDSIASMVQTHHYREGLDGEAVAWAYRRLAIRSESHRFLVVISDGAPTDSATANANDDLFLGRHLRSVVRSIHSAGNGPDSIRLGAIGIDLDLSDTYPNAISLDLTGTLTIGTYGALHRLFGPGRGG